MSGSAPGLLRGDDIGFGTAEILDQEIRATIEDEGCSIANLLPVLTDDGDGIPPVFPRESDMSQVCAPPDSPSHEVCAKSCFRREASFSAALEASALGHALVLVTADESAQDSAGLSDAVIGMSVQCDDPRASSVGLTDAGPVMDTHGSSMYPPPFAPCTYKRSEGA